MYLHRTIACPWEVAACDKNSGAWHVLRLPRGERGTLGLIVCRWLTFGAVATDRLCKPLPSNSFLARSIIPLGMMLTHGGKPLDRVRDALGSARDEVRFHGTPSDRASASCGVVRSMNCRLPVHQSQRVQHIRDLLCILLRKTDRLLAFDASGLIREPVVDCPTFAILAHVEANDGNGALEGDDPLIRLHARNATG